MRLFAYAALATTFLTIPLNSVYAGDDPEALIKDAKLSGEVRYRYEHVDQDGVDNTANAHTVRTNVGLKSGEFKGFQGFVEVQAVTHLGADRFNSLENDQTEFPTVADPDIFQVNEVWIGFNGIADTDIKVGRQKINLDNQRFVGTVGWRQNDQTFDSISISNESIDGLELSYSYVTDVNRIFGDDNPPDNLESVVHLANASY